MINNLKRKKAVLELSNGMKFEGKLIGYDAAVSGEMVFNTGMLGYSESMSDPSYIGQILVFSFCSSFFFLSQSNNLSVLVP